MTIATRLKGYLDSHGVDYELIHHDHSSSSLESARAASVPGGKLAKCVLLEDNLGYLLAVLPASCRIRLDELRWELGRDLELATERELRDLFEDCEVGAVPALGDAYGIPTLIDDSLLRLPDLYLEAGDHEDLVHLSGPAFRELFRGSAHARFGRPN